MPGTPGHKAGYKRNKPVYSRVSTRKSKRIEEPDDFEVNYLKAPTSNCACEPGPFISSRLGYGALPTYGTEYLSRNTKSGDVTKQSSLGEENFELYGYKKHYILHFLTWSMIIGTCGIVRLVFHWYPHWMLLATHARCPLDRADKVLVVEKYKKHKCYHVKDVTVLTQDSCEDDEGKSSGSLTEVVTTQKDLSLPVHVGNGVFRGYDSIRMFTCKKVRYYWNEEKNMFTNLPGLDFKVTTADLHRECGLTAQEQRIRRIVYGNNEIIVSVKSIIALFFLEVLNPFYIFQLFSFCLWFIDNYVYYAVAILVMSVFGIVMSIVQIRRNQMKLRSSVRSVDLATVVRGNNKTMSTITTDQLVPGDLIIIPTHGCVMQCDAVLLTGNCIVNESMLTGESVPVTKTPLPNVDSVAYEGKEHAKHTLYCGTQVIQTRYYGDELVYAVVIRTGFCTSKGSLVRSIMYPPPVDFKFEHDSYRFVTILASVAFFGFVYTSISKYFQGLSISEIAMDALDLITIAVPPALPAAMTVGRVYAQSRLQKKDIYCISPRTINVSGSTDCVCFDKTGTLTEEGLDMWAVVPIDSKSCKTPIHDVQTLERNHLLFGMLTCHSLTKIDGKLTGDPLDLKIFESTNWILEEPDVSDNTKFEMVYPTIVRPKSEVIKLLPCSGDNVFPEGFEIGIIRQFPFSSALQRMSVITKTLHDKDFMVYCKGSPEMIVSLSVPHSVPPDFNSILQVYTEEGYRVIAVAYKRLMKMSYAKIQRIQRDSIEQGLTLVGLVILENRLKPETTNIIKQLRAANIRNIMVTGDNMLTALSVAKDCGIIPCGQRVVLIHSTQKNASTPPVLTYTNYNNAVPPSISCSADSFQATNSPTSVLYFDDHIDGRVINDLEFSPSSNICCNYSLAITGTTWVAIKTFYPELNDKILVRGAVFARMSPDQKQLLIQDLQALGYYVAMCGDGANDCGALKAAHTGISLSEAESSIASPFTSKQPNISCVTSVIREGRAALVTSFGIFKYIATYSLIQFISVMILYSVNSNLTDVEFLYIDLFIITTFVFFFGKTESNPGELSKRPPLNSLISLPSILSLFLHLIVIILTQTIAFYQVQTQDWFIPFAELHNSSGTLVVNTTFNGLSPDELGESTGYENYAIFGVSSFQYITLAVVFSKGRPHRQPLYLNFGLLFSIVLITSCTIYLVLEPAEWLKRFFDLVVPPDYHFRIIVLIYSLAHLLAAYFVEYFIIEYVVSKKLRSKFSIGNESKKKYMVIESKLRDDFSWPEVPKGQIQAVAEKVEEPEVVSKAKKEVGGSNFQRPNFQFGDLESITELGKNRFWSHRHQPATDKVQLGRVRRYSENSKQSVENNFMKMSVPNLSMNVVWQNK